MSRGKTVFFALAAALLVACAWMPAHAQTLVLNGVSPNTTSAPLYTVPNNGSFSVTSMAVSNQSTSRTGWARLVRTDSTVTGYIAVPPGETVEVHFNPPILYIPFDTVRVRTSQPGGLLPGGPLNFTITGSPDAR